MSVRFETGKFPTFGANDPSLHIDVSPPFGCTAVTFYVCQDLGYNNLFTSENDCKLAHGVPNIKEALHFSLIVSHGAFKARGGQLPRRASMPNKRPGRNLLRHRAIHFILKFMAEV